MPGLTVEVGPSALISRKSSSLRSVPIMRAESVPTDLRGAFVTIAETEPVALLVRMAEQANLLSYVLPPVALAFLVLSLALAHDRRRAAAWMGVGVAVCGLLLWIGGRLIENATLPGERVVTATLGTLAAAAEREKIVSPALIVVGHIVPLREKMRGEG